VAGRVRAWFRSIAELATLIQFLGSVGGATVLAVVVPAILEDLIGLPVGLLILLGVGVFFLALAVILSVVKAVLERRAQGKATRQGSVAGQNPAPQSSDWQLWQELNRVKSENDQLRDALQQSEQDNERLRDWNDKIEPFKQHMQLRFVLEAVRRMGDNLHEAREPNVAAMERWVSLTSALLRKNLGDEIANFFLAHDGDTSFTGRLQRLDQISSNQALDMSITVPSDFDVGEAIEPYPIEWTHK